MNPGLILVDIQRDYFPGGRMELVGSIEAGRKASRLLCFFREKKFPVIHIQHISLRAGSTFFLPDTEGVNFDEGVASLPGEAVIQKYFPNSFRATPLQESLESMGLKELVLCGMMSHMCIDATVRAAFDLGYSCTVAHDACATRNLTFNGFEIPAAHVHGAFMAALGAVYANVSGTEELIPTLAERKPHDGRPRF